MNLKFFIVLVALPAFCTLLIRCNGPGNSGVKFDKAKWDLIGDKHLQTYPWRAAMLNDLLANHRIKGLTYKQVLDSLGEPLLDGETGEPSRDTLCYEIAMNFGHHDTESTSYQPKSGSDLFIIFNKDSIATGFKVIHWKNSLPNE